MLSKRKLKVLHQSVCTMQCQWTRRYASLHFVWKTYFALHFPFIEGDTKVASWPNKGIPFSQHDKYTSFQMHITFSV
jgi:hypothetical protein